jgi:hypothetical protein
MWSSACTNAEAEMLYRTGSLLSFLNAAGGCRREVVSTSCEDAGGEAGGVSSWRGVGWGPGEQYGMCLFGTAAALFRWEVLMLR